MNICKGFYNVLIILVFAFTTNVYCFDIKSIFKANTYVGTDRTSWNNEVNDDLITSIEFQGINISAGAYLGNDASVLLKFFSNPEDVGILEYNFTIDSKPFIVKIGKLDIPFFLEKSENIYQRMFLEKSLSEGIEEDNLMGIMIKYKSNLLNISSWLVAPLFSGKKFIENDNKYSFFFRGIYYLSGYNDSMVHLALNYKRVSRHFCEDKPNLGLGSFQDRPATIIHLHTLASHYAHLPIYNVYGFEGATSIGNFYTQAECSIVHALWHDYDNELYNSWYIQGSYVLSGDIRDYCYDSGSFIYPKSRIKDYGLIELAFKVSGYNVTSNGSLLRGANKRDGKKTVFSYGINWSPHDHLKLQLNYSGEKVKYRTKNTPTHTFATFGFRAHLYF